MYFKNNAREKLINQGWVEDTGHTYTRTYIKFREEQFGTMLEIRMVMDNYEWIDLDCRIYSFFKDNNGRLIKEHPYWYCFGVHVHTTFTLIDKMLQKAQAEYAKGHIDDWVFNRVQETLTRLTDRE